MSFQVAGGECLERPWSSVPCVWLFPSQILYNEYVRAGEGFPGL